MATTKLLTEAQYIAQYRKANPIRDCLGSTHGRWKWQRVYDCIDLTKGFASKALAARARMDSARSAYAGYVRSHEQATCPKCKEPTSRQWVEDIGMCSACAERQYR